VGPAEAGERDQPTAASASACLSPCGTHNPLGQVSYDEFVAKGSGGGLRRGDWPVLLRGAASHLLEPGQESIWHSDPGIASIMETDTVEWLHVTGDDNPVLPVGEWIRDRELQCAYKSNNLGVTIS